MRPFLVIAGVVCATGLLVAQQATAKSVAPKTPPAAPPHVQPFASALPGVEHRPKKKREQVEVPAKVDGCDHGYGVIEQCVPWSFPPGPRTYEAKCAWLTAHGFTTLRVRGGDRHGLDPDGNGIACG
jgi:hypothetical protein